MSTSWKEESSEEIKNSVNVKEHPLQEVTESFDDAEKTTTITNRTVNKGNWVKFDDELNDDEKGPVLNSEHFQNSIENKLLTSIPSTLVASSQRLREPIDGKEDNSNTTTSTSDHDQLSSSLRSTQMNQSQTSHVSAPTEATKPAVLATESIHVNLNTSGKSQLALSTSTPQKLFLDNATIKPHNNNNSNSNRHNNQNNNNNNQKIHSTGHINGPSHLQQANSQQHQHQHQHQPQHQHHHHQLSHHNYNNGSTPTVMATKPNVLPNSGIDAMISSSAVGTNVIVVDGSAVSRTNTNSNPVVQQNTPLSQTPAMRTIELPTGGRIREGFANGDIIVTLLPANTKWPWITPAIFRPELVPEELMAQGLTLTVEEYVSAMETLVNDYRFTLYNTCYKRVLVLWILFAFAVLLSLLFSGIQGVALFSLGVGWLFLNAAAIFFCMWIKLRVSRGLEKCLARVNRQLIKHKILLVLDDRGHISCHKVNLCFLYFDSSQCIQFLNEFLEQTEQNGGEAIKAGWESKLDIDVNDIVIQGANPVRVSRRQERGVQLYLRYASRWGMEALRGLLETTPMEEAGRHCAQFQCPCQYISEHIRCKPRVVIEGLHQLIGTRSNIFGN